jgi:hypothetical protein
MNRMKMKPTLNENKALLFMKENTLATEDLKI